MDVVTLLGSLLLLRSAWAQGDRCDSPMNTGDNSIRFPQYRLSFDDLRQSVMGGAISSRTYYEVYSLDPKPSILPILRKVAVRWNLVSPLTSFPGNFTNDYTGWLPWESRCEQGIITFETLPDLYTKFRFEVVFPEAAWFIGTSFSSCPERYLINFYCPETELVPNVYNPRYCRNGTRMSIYSATGPQGLPWHLVVEDLCKNGIPKLDDIRWTFTYDAPQQCQFSSGGRKKRSTDVRHYF